jgi:hypothetical protein
LNAANESSGISRSETIDLARQLTRRAVHEVVRATGGRTTARQVFRDRPDLDMTVTEVEPLAGLRAATQLKHAAHRLTLDYARQAREDGRSWHEIGTGLGLGGPEPYCTSPAAAAYDYATRTGPPGRPIFAWVCPACRASVRDRGPEAGHPADCEEGHADGCPRLVAAAAQWTASWDEQDG